MLIWFLLAIFLFMYVVTYYAFGEDVICPAFILMTGYVGCILAACANIENWAIDLHWETVGVLVVGTLTFLLTAYFVFRFMRKHYSVFRGIVTDRSVIRVNDRHVKLFCLFQIVLMVLWVFVILHSTGDMFDGESWTERMVAFRHWSSYSTEWMNDGMFFLINQLAQVVSVSSWIFAYVLLHNYVLNHSLSENRYLILNLVLNVCFQILQGGRGGIVALIMACGMLYIFFDRKCNGRIFKITLWKIVKISGLVCFSAIAFYYAKALVGRGASDLDFSHVFEYITMYVGGPIQLLDMFLQNPVPASEIFGKETFYMFNTQMIRAGIIDAEPYIMHLEFRDAVTGAFLGNIYTSYRSYLYDFGIAGLIFMPMLASLIINFVYYKFRFDGNLLKYNFWGIFFAMSFYNIFIDFARGLFLVGLSFGLLKMFVIAVIVSSIVLKDYRLGLRFVWGIEPTGDRPPWVE